MTIWNVGWLILFLSLFKPLKGLIVGAKYEYYKKIKSRNNIFVVHEEPNLNLTCEEFSTNKTFIAHFVDYKLNVRHSFLVGYQIPKIESTIDILHNRIINNINKSDDLQFFLENNPQRDDVTREYEKYNHHVKQDLSTLRKLESFLIKYKPDHSRKPIYSGEERDNVNTY